MLVNDDRLYVAALDTVTNMSAVATDIQGLSADAKVAVAEAREYVEKAVKKAARTPLAKVYEVTANGDVDRTIQDGVAWFDPGTWVKVVTAAKEAAPAETAHILVRLNRRAIRRACSGGNASYRLATVCVFRLSITKRTFVACG